MKLFTAPMKLLTAVVLEKHADRVTRELLSQGVLDFVSVSAFSREDASFLAHYQGSSSRNAVTEVRRRIENILQQADLPLPPVSTMDIKNLASFKMDEYESRLEKLNKNLLVRRERQKLLNQEILKLQELEKHLAAGPSGGKPASSKNQFLVIRTGRLLSGSPEDLEKSLALIPHFILADGEKPDRPVVLVSLKRETSQVDEILARYKWEEVIPVQKPREEEEAIRKELREKISALRLRQETLQKEIRSEIEVRKPDLDSMWVNLRMNELYAQVQESFSQTARTVVFSGWLPADSSEALETGIRKASEGECIISWSFAENYPREKVPVAVKTSRVMAPFQMLVNNYAVPEYGSINPVPFVAAAYLCMFGLMFGDAGQGAVISLLGVLGLLFVKKATPGIKNLFQLLVYCGLASVTAGILFGSYFGYPWFPPLWFNYHQAVLGHSTAGPVADVYGILKITIFFGIAVIGMGLVLNWINLFRKRSWFLLLLDKTGLLGGWMYAWGIYTAFYFTARNYRELPGGNLLALVFGIPVLILLFKAPLHHFLDKNRRAHGLGPSDILDFFMEWIVELLEIFSGYLANTLSFMRVAGLGIAHVSLMAAFESISEMAGGGLAGLLILVLGNILVIGLEGLSAGIQALRLNYYEFFSKYFTGKGIAYNPVSLKSRRAA